MKSNRAKKNNLECILTITKCMVFMPMKYIGCT